MRRHFGWDKKYLHWGVTAFCVIAASVLFYMFLSNFPVVKAGINKFFSILSPFIWGLVLTYLLSPLMRFFERLFTKKGKKSGKTARIFAVIISEVILILIIFAFVYLIIPQLYSSIETIVVNTPVYFEKVSAWVQEKLVNHPDAEEYVTSALQSFSQGFVELVKEKVLPSIGNVVSGVTTGVVAVVTAIFNLVVGVIASVYLLSNLEAFLGGVRRILYSIFSLETAEDIRNAFKFIDKTFMDFIIGKILDSAIMGLICYIVCAILNMPYALLVSVIVGVTNIIPFFGPFIGGIPSALIILLVDPLKCLIFIIFIVILQQVDGNIIGPKIMGSTIGVNGFWIMFAIIVGGGFFGFIGMIVGVPLFVVIYTAIKNGISKKLKKEDLPVEFKEYEDLDYIDIATREIHKVNKSYKAYKPGRTKK